MSVASLINRPATLLRRTDSGETNEFGTPIQTVTETEVFCDLQQRDSDEPDDQGEFSDATYNLYVLPVDTEVQTKDAFDIDGEIYEVVGKPWKPRNPRTGQFSHIQARVRVAGSG